MINEVIFLLYYHSQKSTDACLWHSEGTQPAMIAAFCCLRVHLKCRFALTASKQV